jgi:outer membrane protein OmpA-like peptidoglycan-associated protein
MAKGKRERANIVGVLALILESEIVAIGMGSKRPLVTPDDLPAEKAKNRRYEIQLRF